MVLEESARVDLLGPFDDLRVGPGRRRLYPFDRMEVGQWFQVELSSGTPASNIRSAAYSFHRKHPHVRFTVRVMPCETASGFDTVVCLRIK